jgi:hypothetical protein
MKNFILTTILFLIIANSFAGIKRLGYWGTPVAGVDYATPALAVAACAVGDSIYVYGSNVGAAWAIDITKRLVIIGTGYFYAPNTPSNAVNFNANLQVYGAYSQANITLNDGSSNSIIVGIVGRVICNQLHTASINNIRISNCYWNSFNGASMYKNGITYDGWEISKCYIASFSIGYPASQTAKVTNFKFYNNILQSAELVFGNVAGQSAIIENCTFYSYYSQTNNWNGVSLLVQNCIFVSTIVSAYNNTVFNNCVVDGSPSPAFVGANNILNANSSNIFLGLPTQGTNTDDGRWALKAASPAIGAGIAGIDCGAYGGVNPYKLSGIPAIPAFYKLTAPSTSASSNPYTITFSVRANN